VELLCHTGESVTFSKKQAAFLLGCCFFEFFDGVKNRPQYPPGKGFNIFTLSLLWRRGMKSPLKAFLHYMNRMADEKVLDQPLRFSRFGLPKSYSIFQSEIASKPLCKVRVR
jgi:hypothetical protein